MDRKRQSAVAHSDVIRQQIMDAANQLFYHRGYNQTSFTDIAEAAGVPRGNFYYYFKTKDEILGAVIDRRVERIREMLAAWDAESADPRARLKRFLDMVRNSQDDLSRYGCPMGSLNIELGKAQPTLKAKAKQMFDLFRDWLAAQFAVLGRRDADELAVHLLGQAQGVSVLTQVYGDGDYLRRELDALASWLDSGS
jgi:AcrR family transcriptional regulator